MPTEIADLMPDQVGRMETLANEPGRENVEAVSADLVAMLQATQMDERAAAAGSRLNAPQPALAMLTHPRDTGWVRCSAM